MNYGDHIGDVARQLCPNFNQTLSTKSQLRFGAHGSLAVEIAGDKAGSWFSHEDGTGGGTLDLIIREGKASDLPGAIRWLESQGYAEPQGAGERKSAGRRQRGPLETTYQYTDESGTALFRVLRYCNPKDFSQERYEGGRWIPRLGDVRRVPYRLPLLLGAIRAGRIVFICEGEKDADRLCSHGLVATTNQGGAGNWPDALTSHFRGADVVILPHNDGPGRDHAAKVADKLIGVAKRIRVLDLAKNMPALPDKGDVSDWLDAGRTTDDLEYLVEQCPDFQPNGAENQPRSIRATPYVWTSPDQLPRREWIYGRHLIRRHVAATIAPGAAGKTNLLIGEGLAMSTGRNLYGKNVPGDPLRVWIWNLEDDPIELKRRVQAACLHFGITQGDLGGRLFLDNGRDQELCIASEDHGGTVIHEPVVDDLVAELRDRQIDAFSVDPFISSHRVTENDNVAIDRVVKAWARVSHLANCSIELVHHARKLGGQEVNAESSRGAIALVAAARDVRVINRMTTEEAQRAGVDEPRRYLRLMSDKANLAPPCNASDWYRLESVELPNAGVLNGLQLPGDSVGVISRWEWPDPLDGVTVADLRAIQDAIGKGGRRESPQAKEWAGYAVADVLGLDASDTIDRDKIRGMIKVWIGNDALRVVERADGARHTRKFVVSGNYAT